MRKLITTIALLVLVDSSAAIAQPAGLRNPAAPPSMNSAEQLPPEALPGPRTQNGPCRTWTPPCAQP